MLSVTVSVPELKIPPPWRPAALPVIVLLVMTRVAKLLLSIPPPAPVVELAAIDELEIVSSPLESLSMPPPVLE